MIITLRRSRTCFVRMFQEFACLVRSNSICVEVLGAGNRSWNVMEEEEEEGCEKEKEEEEEKKTIGPQHILLSYTKCLSPSDLK